ncbi:hypothetical protein AAMO2058_000892800 [Amorphochlora amoebiformis]
MESDPCCQREWSWSARRLASRWTWVCLLLLSMPVVPVHGSGVCFCKCCALSNNCNKVSFDTNEDCNSCTKDACRAWDKEKCDVSEISATCTERDSLFSKAMVFTFMAVTLILTGIALLSHKIVWLRNFVRLFR